MEAEAIDLAALVRSDQQGDLDAYGQVVHATQTMAYAIARGVVRDAALAADVAQEAFIRAYSRLGSLEAPAAFRGWLRRIVLTVAMNMRRSRRHTLLRLDDVPELPILDEAETTWSDPQRLRLASALLTLSAEERRVCDRRYHVGGRSPVSRRMPGSTKRPCANACSASATSCERTSR